MLLQCKRKCGMNGVDYMADTNALIYLLSGDSCMKSYLANYIGLSVISEIELLSFPGITSFEEQQIRSYKCTVEQNINFGNCCIDARNAHTFIIEFAVSKLDVFFSRAISAAENKRSVKLNN